GPRMDQIDQVRGSHRAMTGGDARMACDRAKTHKPNGNGKDHDWRANAISAAKLRTLEFPPAWYIVPGFIPEGLCILAGKPKIGKSWMALDLCLGVAGGHRVLGSVEPIVGDVLYLALEDTPRRLQRRINKLLYGKPWPERLTLCTKWR